MSILLLMDDGPPFPRSLFSAGEQGIWLDPSDFSTLFQDAAGTTPVTAVGQPVGKILDKSGRGNHATQSTSSKRPVLPSAGYRLRSDFTDDALVAPSVGSAELYIKTPYGSYRAADLSAGSWNLPLNDATGVIARDGTLNETQRAAIFNYFGGNKKYMVALSTDTVISNLRIYTGGAVTPLLFVGGNGVQVTKSLSLNSDTSYDVSADGLTAPVAVCWPNTLIANTALTVFCCYSNQLTGSIPSLTTNTALTVFYCQYNQLTGSIPSLTTNTALTQFYCYSNQLTSWTGGTVSATLGDFQAQNNLLTGAAVNAILAAFVAAGRTTGTRVLNLGGTGNAAPTGAGITDKATLVSRGWTVTTN